MERTRHEGVFTRDRPFDEPLPIFPPVAIERIRSQRGYFTVFGNNKAPLDGQLKSGLKCLEKVSISPETATFALIQGLSPFEVFRDLDSLGKSWLPGSQRFNAKLSTASPHEPNKAFNPTGNKPARESAGLTWTFLSAGLQTERPCR